LKYHEEAHSATGVYKLDLETNHITRLDYEDGREAGECVFVPRANSVDEDDGYLMTFTYHNHKKISEFMVIDARSMKVVTVIDLPQRVPWGFHATYITRDELKAEQ
jgi:9-cis-epoxycarotenoid dioxygenase